MGTRKDYLSILHDRFSGKITIPNYKYTKLKDKYTFVCSLHGEFTTTLDSILTSTYGCPGCKRIGVSKKLTRSFEEFADVANTVHDNKYEYLRIDEKYVYYMCPEHGEYRQNKADHLQGTGCKHCGHALISKAKRYTDAELLSRLEKLQSGYDYSGCYLIYEKSREEPHTCV